MNVGEQVNFVRVVRAWVDEPVDVDVAVKVAVNQVGEFINEWVARVQVEEAKAANPAPVDVAFQ